MTKGVPLRRDTTDLLESRGGAIVTLTLNRPEGMYAFSDPMLLSLIEACRYRR